MFEKHRGTGSYILTLTLEAAIEHTEARNIFYHVYDVHNSLEPCKTLPGGHALEVSILTHLDLIYVCKQLQEPIKFILGSLWEVELREYVYQNKTVLGIYPYLKVFKSF